MKPGQSPPQSQAALQPGRGHSLVLTHQRGQSLTHSTRAGVEITVSRQKAVVGLLGDRASGSPCGPRTPCEVKKFGAGKRGEGAVFSASRCRGAGARPERAGGHEGPPAPPMLQVALVWPQESRQPPSGPPWQWALC